jgi:putative transposase
VSKQAHQQNQSKELVDTINHQDILNEIARYRMRHPVLGLKKLYHKVKPLTMGRDQFITLAQSANLGIEKPKNYRRTTYSTKSNRYKNLLDSIVLDDINQVWVSDITYFWVLDKFLYIVLIMDLYSRHLIGYHASASLSATANVQALKMAFKNRKGYDLSQLIHHSDKGSQYIFDEYTQMLDDKNIAISMSNIVYENSHSERLNGIIKNEYLIHRNIQSLDILQKQLAKDASLYNQERPHWELGMMTPVEYEIHIKLIPKSQRTKINIYVDKSTIRKQKLANQMVLF